MKVIDLLNKIANGEDVPKKIKITILDDRITKKYCFCYDEENQEYKDDELFPLGARLILERVLNEKVEIIEEDKEIEHYDMFDNFTGFGFGGTDKELLSDLQNNFEHINEELDYLIKVVNELKKGK